MLFETTYPYPDYIEDFVDEEQEYAEFLDECTEKYAADYVRENAMAFVDYLEYSGYEIKEFLMWTEKEKHGAYVDFLHEADDREEYIRERENIL